jgi:hypothetical protein
MSCVNPNSPEFQSILKKEPNFLLAELIYKELMDKQNVVLYDDVRDLKEAAPDKRNKEFIGSTENWGYPLIDTVMRLTDKEVAALMKRPEYKITNPLDQDRFTELVNAVGEKEAYRDYFEHNQVVRTSEAVIEKLNERLESEDFDPINTITDLDNGSEFGFDDFIKDFNKTVDTVNQSKAIAVATKMSEQLGIPFEVITMDDMERLFPGQPYRQNFYQAGKVYLVAGAFDQNSVFHEFSHPIIKSMSVQNPELFQSLFNELGQTELGQQIINDLIADPHYNQGTREFMEEAIVRSLEAINADESAAPKGFISNLFFQIKQFLRKMFGKKVDVSKLNSKTKLKDLVNMINYGEEFILDTDFLNQDLMVMFQTDYDQLKAQLKDSAAKQTQELMNNFYNVVKVQLANFKAENDIFKLIESQLADENREGVLNQMQQILEGLATIGSNKLVKPLESLNITGNAALDADIIEFNNKISSFVQVLSMTDQMFDLFNKKLIELQKNGVTENEDFDQLFAIMQYNDDWLEKLQQWKNEFTTTSLVSGSVAFTDIIDPVTGLSSNPIRDALDDLINKLQRTKSMSNALQVDSVIDVLYDHLTKQLAPVKKDYLEQMASLKAAGSLAQYNRLHQEYYGVTAEEMAEMNRLKAKSPQTLTREEEIRLEELTRKSYDSHNITKEALRARAEGRLGDSRKWNGLLESYLSNQDVIVGGFYSFLMKTFNTIDGNANARRSEMLEGLKPLLAAAGYDTHWLGEGQLGKDIGQVNRSYEKDEYGNIQEFMEYKFISNFINWEFDLQKLRQDIVTARQNYNSNPSQANKDAWTQAKNALEQFESDYMNREYVQAFYDVKNKYFSTPEGEKAREALQDVFDRMQIIAENVDIDPTNFGSVEELNKLWNEYQRLHSLYDVDGNEKTGIAKDIAEILSGYRNDISEFYEWEEREDAFENAFARFNQALIDQGKIPGEPAHTEAVRKWLETNTTIAVKEEFYQIREQLLEARSQTIQPIVDINNSLVDLAPMYAKVYAILKPTKDNFNQFDGNQLTPTAQITIRDIQQTIATVKDQWIQLFGGSKDELRKYREIEFFRDRNNGQFRDEDDANYYYGFWDEMQARLEDDFNITKADMDFVRDLDKTLSSMSVSGLTQYYISAFMDFANTNDESMEIFERMFPDLDIAEGDVPTSEQIYEVVTSPYWSASLSKVNADFKSWFERNHYQQMADEYDSTGNFVGEYLANRPTSAWKFSIPEDNQYYETKSVIGTGVPNTFAPNGFIELDGIPRIPTRAYYRRKVKEEFKTQKVERDYVDANGNLVLANVDNRDQWLPKDFNPGDTGSAKDSKYIDGNYKKMFETERAKWNLLDHLRTSHLNNQRGLDNSQKLYLSYPRYRKGVTEGYDKNYFKRKAARINDALYGGADDAEYGLFLGSSTRLNYKTLTRPIGGSYKLPIIDVSTNIIDSMMDHAYSIEHFKGMRKVNSFANVFENAMVNLAANPQKTELEKKLNDAALLTAKESDTQERIKQIRSILNKHFKGEQLSETNSTMIGIVRGTVALQRWMSFTSFALDPIKSLTNYFGGKSMMWKKAAEGMIYNAQDVALTRGKSASAISELIATMYSNKQVSPKLQLLDVLGAIPGNLKKEIGARGSKTVQQSIMEGKFFYFDRRYLSDSVPVHQFYAILNHNSFMLDGKKTTLDDAVELVNGKIQTKPGVPKDMSISYDAEGNVVLGDKLKDLMNEHQSLLQKSLGIGNEFTEAEVYRTAIGKFVFFLMKFFPGMLLDRYQIRTKKGKRGQRRLNYATRRAEAGTYLSAITLIQELISNKGRFWQFNAYSWQAKKGALQLALAYAISMVINMLSSTVGFDDDDDGLIDFTFDPNAENIYSQLRKSTSLPQLPLISEKRTLVKSNRNFDPETYLKLQLLRLELRVKREEETFMPFNALGTAGDLAMLNSPLSDGGGVKTIKDISKSLYQTYWLDDPDLYERAAGPYVFQEADKNKAWNLALKSIGLSGSLIDPATSIERENSDFFN